MKGLQEYSLAARLSTPARWTALCKSARLSASTNLADTMPAHRFTRHASEIHPESLEKREEGLKQRKKI